LGKGTTRLASLGEPTGLGGLIFNSYKTGGDAAMVKWTRNVRSGEDMGIKDERNEDESLGEEHGEKTCGRERIKEWRGQVMETKKV